MFVIGDHRLAVYPDGPQRLVKLLSLIDAAADRIDWVAYVIADDRSGQMVLAALHRALARGVTLRMMIDSFGWSMSSHAPLDRLTEAGAEVLFFSRRLRSSYLIRNHQKIWLFDGATVMAGGFNQQDDYFGMADTRNWADFGYVMTGPAAADLARWTDGLWSYCRDLDGRVRPLQRLVAEWRGGAGAIEWVMGGPTQRLSPWAAAVRGDIRTGKQVDLVMAYFSPGIAMLRPLIRAARHGTVRLLLAGKSDNGATIGASRLLYGWLLRRGIAIAEYQPQPLHAKLVVVDDIVYLGSGNFDQRSLYINVEIMARINDAALADHVRELIAAMAADAKPITRAAYRAMRGPLTRLRWLLSWFVVAVVDYSVTRRMNFGLTDAGDPRSQPELSPRQPQNK